MTEKRKKPQKSLQQQSTELQKMIRIEIIFSMFFLLIFCVDNFELLRQKRLNELSEIYLLLFGVGMLLSAVYFGVQLIRVKAKLNRQEIKNAGD